MEDYDPDTFRKSRGEVAAAWVLCTVLLLALLVGSLINGNASTKETAGQVSAKYLQGLARER